MTSLSEKYLLKGTEIQKICGVSRKIWVENIRPHLPEVRLGEKTFRYRRVDLDKFIGENLSASDGSKEMKCYSNADKFGTSEKPSLSDEEKLCYERARKARQSG